LGARPPGASRATARATAAVLTAAAVQGIVLVTIPAASVVFTRDYGLSSTRYGAMFLPQVVTAIAGAILGAEAGRRYGTKRIFLVGLVGGLLAMIALLASLPLEGRPAAYPLLLAATGFVGAGFGLAVPAMNSLTAALHPGGVDAAVLALNALLGVGTALAPLFVALFVGLGFWWGLPLLSAILLAAVIGFGATQPLSAATGPRQARRRMPNRFWWYATFAVLYGVCETITGNWSETDLTSGLHLSTVVASIALTAFWAMVTLGRVAFALAERWWPPTRTYRLLPLLLALAFALVAALPAGRPVPAVLAVGLVGLGCSALLPLTISLAQQELAAVATVVTGGVIAAYQLGYGIAAFGVGPLHSAGLSLSAAYGLAGLVALVLAGLAVVITRRSAPRRASR
jgi:Major Facilitator Superfamily